MTVLTTQRLLLRPALDHDLDALHAVFSHPDAMQYWSTAPHDDPKQTTDFIRGMKTVPTEFVIEFQGWVIGKAGFWQPPEIGFILHPDSWGQGLATEALSALIDYGFTALRLAKITADVDPRNEGSIRLLTKLGFRKTGRESATIQIGGIWYDSVYFTLKRPED